MMPTVGFRDMDGRGDQNNYILKNIPSIDFYPQVKRWIN